MPSGYTRCECCGDDTISSDVTKPEPCELCEESGCSMEAGDTCERSDYDPEYLIADAEEDHPDWYRNPTEDRMDREQDHE